MLNISVIVSPLAFAKIVDWTSSNTEREVGGYLIGNVKGKTVEIVDSTFAVSSSTPTHVQIDEMAQFRIVEEIEKRGGKETIVGFWHTHPGMSVFMSGTDIATHKVYQALLPEAVAMVNDGNTFARSRDQNDFKAKFFRVNESGKAYEVPFNVMTNPNELLDLLTQHVQDQENAEKIAQNTAQHMSLAITKNIESLADKKLVSKKDFADDNQKIKLALAKTREDIEDLKSISMTKDDFEQYKLLRHQNAKITRYILWSSLGISVLNFIILLIVLVFTLIP